MHNRRVMKLGQSIAVLLLVMLVSPDLISAQQKSAQKWSVYLGNSFFTGDTRLALYSPTLGQGVLVDWEDTLGLDDDAGTFRANVLYRFGQRRRHELELNYFRVSRTGSISLSEDFEIGDTVFTVGTEVFPELITEDLVIGYTYYFISNDKGDLGISPGIHGIGIDVTVSGFLIIEPGPGEQPIEFEAIEGSANEFPLPVVGLRGSYRPTPKLLLSGGFRWLDVKLGEYEGGLMDAFVRLEHETFRNMGFGVGYGMLSMDVSRDSGDQLLIATADIEYEGPEVFIRVRF